jgi:hypothetical protein
MVSLAKFKLILVARLARRHVISCDNLDENGATLDRGFWLPIHLAAGSPCVSSQAQGRSTVSARTSKRSECPAAVLARGSNDFQRIEQSRILGACHFDLRQIQAADDLENASGNDFEIALRKLTGSAGTGGEPSQDSLTEPA